MLAHRHTHPIVTPTPQSTPTNLLDARRMQTVPISGDEPAMQHHQHAHGGLQAMTADQQQHIALRIIEERQTLDNQTSILTPSQSYHAPREHSDSDASGTRSPMQWLKVEETKESKHAKRFWVISDLLLCLYFPAYATLVAINSPLGHSQLNDEQCSTSVYFFIGCYAATCVVLLPRHKFGYTGCQFAMETMLTLINCIVIADYSARGCAAASNLALFTVVSIAVVTARLLFQLCVTVYNMMLQDSDTTDTTSDELTLPTDASILDNTGEQALSATEYQQMLQSVIADIQQSATERGETLTQPQLHEIATRILRNHITSNVAGISNIQQRQQSGVNPHATPASPESASFQLTESQEQELHNRLTEQFPNSPFARNTPRGDITSLQSPRPRQDSHPAALTMEQVVELDSFICTETHLSAQTQTIVDGCSICCEQYQEKEELKFLPCFHLFHAQCANQWLITKNMCPTCRQPALVYAA